MAKKPTSLDAIMGGAISGATQSPEPQPTPQAQAPQNPTEALTPASGGRAPQTKSVTMYTTPTGLKRLKTIALEGDTKVNSILRQAVDEWLRVNGHGGLDAIERSV